MDPFSRSWYRAQFQIRFMGLKGEAFQDFFADVMSRRYPNDFIRTRPWGKVGDRKNDGYRTSCRELFQVYAPDELKAKESIDKIKEDFDSALPHWKDFFDRWTFVHNSRKGLGPEVLTCLLSLDGSHAEIAIGHFGFEAFEKEVMLLPPDDLEALFGPAPDARSFSQVRNEDLILVLDHLIRAHPADDVDISPVSVQKINKNSLGDDSKFYLETGMRKSGQVKEIFDRFADPLKGEQIAQGFRDKYQELKLQDLPSDTILSELIGFAEDYKNYQVLANQERQKQHGATAAIIAYLFERCDVFEDPES